MKRPEWPQPDCSGQRIPSENKNYDRHRITSSSAHPFCLAYLPARGSSPRKRGRHATSRCRPAQDLGGSGRYSDRYVHPAQQLALGLCADSVFPSRGLGAGTPSLGAAGRGCGLFSSLIYGVLAVPLERLLRESGVKTVAIAHGLDALWAFPPYQWTLERAFTRLDAVVAVSAATGQACLDRGLDSAKLHIIPNGIDLERFGSHPRPRRDQVFLGGRSLPSEAFLLCSVGRQVRRKGFPWFVDFASASRQRSDGLLSEKQAFIYRESPRRSSTPNRRLLNPTAAVDLCQSRLSGMTATIWIAPYPSYGRGKNKAIGRGIRLRKVRAAQVASEHGPSVSE